MSVVCGVECYPLDVTQRDLYKFQIVLFAPTGIMPEFEWVIKPTDHCDVRLERGERTILGEPLFFCPAAAVVAANFDLGAATIAREVSAAQMAGVVHRDDALGRVAIDNVLKCRPTSFRRLINTVNVINFIMMGRGHQDQLLPSKSIIAAVFRIRDFDRMLTELKLAPREVADAAKVDENFVESLRARYRLNLEPTLKILQAAKSNPKVRSSRWHEKLVKDGLRSIVVDRVPRANVQRLGEEESNGSPIYLLNQDNLVAAPANGHPWSIG